MASHFQFQPISFSWVAIHPQPKAVIQFMGGAFFGSFPTLFYRYFLQTLFEAGYTIVALPFRFSFRHWSIARDLLQEQAALRQLLTQQTGSLFYQDSANYFWVGHSLGCKYIALLELLSGQWSNQATVCLPLASLPDISILEQGGILNQPSLLIAPDLSNTESAIPIRPIARGLDWLGLGVLPTREQTQCLIEHSNLFNLTALVAFAEDKLAGNPDDATRDPETQTNSDLLWLMQQLARRRFPLLQCNLPGQHLEPLGLRFGSVVIRFNPLGQWIQSLKQRLLERTTLQLLEELEQRQISLNAKALDPKTAQPGETVASAVLAPEAQPAEPSLY
ncbi:MAG: DUF1350 family protein [Elainella sp.]